MRGGPRQRRAWRSWGLLVGYILGSSCSAGTGESGESSGSGGADTGDSDDAGSVWPLPRTCPPPPGLGRPATIEQVVDLVNALPKPTSLPCLLESLERPLAIYASTSTAGAQPATGPHNPRIFVLMGDLVMSVVSEGEARQTLELGLAIGERRSIKAELVFPVEGMLGPEAPYEQVEFGVGTSCGVCHGAEAQVSTIDVATAWASDVFQDDPDQELSLSFLRQSARDCDPQAEPERCEMLGAIFGHGEVDAGDLARDALICRPP
ncbi:MAG: hypothetical protein AAGF11_24475 [Myxococcota bacterium]